MKFEKAPELKDEQEISQESNPEQSGNEKHAEKIQDTHFLELYNEGVAA